MKYIVLLSLLTLIGCGDKQETPVAQNAIVVSTPTPTPQVTQNFVGNWIDIRNNELDINADGTALSSTQKISWTLDDKYIFFYINTTQLDFCSYQVSSIGNLITNISIQLSLACIKSGQLIYTKKS